MTSQESTGPTDGASESRYLSYAEFRRLLECGIITQIDNFHARRTHVGKLWSHLSGSHVAPHHVIMVCPMTMIRRDLCPQRDCDHIAKYHGHKSVLLDIGSFLKDWAAMRPRKLGTVIVEDLELFAQWLRDGNVAGLTAYEIEQSSKTVYGPSSGYLNRRDFGSLCLKASPRLKPGQITSFWQILCISALWQFASEPSPIEVVCLKCSQLVKGTLCVTDRQHVSRETSAFAINASSLVEHAAEFLAWSPLKVDARYRELLGELAKN